jgi:hypothetical protein
MGQITVAFSGVCVHVAKADVPSLSPARRVILLSNPTGTKIHGKTIEPHVPTLHLPHGSSVSLGCAVSLGGSGKYRLQGVTLRIANAVASGIVLDPTFALLTHMTPPGAQLAPNLGVIVNGVAPAAAYFDIDNGTLAACQATAGHATGTQLTVQTVGDPILELVCFDGSGSTQVTLPTATNVTLSNSAANGADDDDDYLLSYDVCATVPANPVKPNAPGVPLPACFSFPITSNDFGPSCSNMNFP